VIARVAKEFDILTVAVVTKPFQFEGSRRMRVAEVGIAELRKHVDTLLVIPNQNLFRVATGSTTFAEAFVLADQVLYSGIACIVDLIVKEGLINLDLADVRTVLSGMGTAMMGTGEASGEQRAIVAAEEAIVNPLLDDVTLKGAKSLLLSITGGHDLLLWEVDEAANRVRQEVDPDANIIVGATFDLALGDRVRVSIVASGMARAAHAANGTDAAARGDRRQGRAAGSSEDYRRRLTEAIGGDLAAPADQGADAYSPDGPLSSLSPAKRGKNGAETGPDAKRSSTRMPAVEDFPPVGQREYWAKSGDPKGQPVRPETGHAHHPGPESPAPKTSLLRRLTGAGRARASTQPKVEEAAARPGPSVTNEDVDLPVFFGRKKR
jgi:cell division protein FtsZ